MDLHFEVKCTATVRPEHTAALRRWLELTGGDAGTAAVVADVHRSLALAPGVRAVPWSIV